MEVSERLPKRWINGKALLFRHIFIPCNWCSIDWMTQIHFEHFPFPLLHWHRRHILNAVWNWNEFYRINYWWYLYTARFSAGKILFSNILSTWYYSLTIMQELMLLYRYNSYWQYHVKIYVIIPQYDNSL